MRYQIIMNGIPWSGVMESEMNARRVAWWLTIRHWYNELMDFNIIEIDENNVRSLLTNPEEPRHIRFRPLNKMKDVLWVI